MTCRKTIGDIETGDALRPRDEPGGCLSIGQAVSRIEVARAWSGLLCGTREPVVPRPRAASGAASACGRGWKGGLQAAETVRGRVPMRGTGADRLVVTSRGTSTSSGTCATNAERRRLVGACRIDAVLYE